MAKEQRSDSDSDLFFLGIVIICVFGAFYLWTQFLLEKPAYYVLHYTKSFLDTMPIFKVFAHPQNYQDFLQQYNQTIYANPKNHAVQQLNVSLPYFIWLFIPVALRAFYKTLKKTQACTFNKKIDTLDKLVEAKIDDFPIIESGYQAGSALTKNPELAEFGRFAQEYGPIRWSILNGIVMRNGNYLHFPNRIPPQLVNMQNLEEVPDNHDVLQRLKGSLDYNANRLHDALKSQAGKPFKHYTLLEDHHLALCNMFMTFARGHKFKQDAQKLRDKYARSYTAKKIGTQKESYTFNIDRKAEIKLHEKLRKHVNSRYINVASLDRMYVLSCYAVAKMNGADVAPVEFLWLKGIDRELYLLLNCYSGDPKTIKNNGFVEIFSGLTHWLNLFELVSLDLNSGMANSNGYYDPQNNQSKLLLSQVCHSAFFIKNNRVSYKDGLKKPLRSVVTSVKAAHQKNASVDIRDSYNRNKLISKLPDEPALKAAEKKALGQYPYNDFSEMCFAIFMMRLESSLKASSKDQLTIESVEEVLAAIEWTKLTDYRFYLRVASTLLLMALSKATFKDIIYSDIQSALGMSINQIVVADFPLYTINANNVIIKLDEENDETEYPFLDGWALITAYKIAVHGKKYSSAQLELLINDISPAISKSMVSYQYYMSSFEGWLKPEYTITFDQVLGDFTGISDISKV